MKWYLIVLLLSSSSAVADSSFTAGELMKDCKADTTKLTSTLDDHYSRGVCAGYILGWMDASTDSVILTKDGPATVAFEDGVDVGQIKRVFMKYIDEHPEVEHEPASRTLPKIMQEAHLAHAVAVKQPLVREQ